MPREIEHQEGDEGQELHISLKSEVPPRVPKAPRPPRGYDKLGTFGALPPVPNTVTLPNFELPTAPERNRYGWLLLAVVVAFLVVTQLVPYLSRPTDGKAGFQRYETVLQGYVTQKEAMVSLAKMAGIAKPPSQDSLDESLEDPISDLAAVRHDSADAARLYAAMRTEVRVRVTLEDLEALRKEPTPRNKAFLQIYGSDKLSLEEAEGLARTLDSKKFLDRLALAHAREKAGADNPRRGLTNPKQAAVLAAAGTAFAGALMLGMVLWPIYFGARSAGKCKPLGHPVGTLTPALADRHAMRAAQILLGMVFLSMLLRPVLPDWPEYLDGPAFSAAMLAVVVILARIPVWGMKISLRSIGIHRNDLGVNILWGIGGALANVPMVLTLGVLGVEAFKFLPPPEHPSSSALMANPSVPMVLATLFSASLMAPLIEETCFRGLLFPAITTAFRHVPSGVLLSSLIFAAIHPTGIPAWPALAAVGAMGAVLTYQTRSLVPAIVMHAVHNAGTLLLALSISSG